MSKTQDAFNKNLKSLTKPKPKPKSKRKPKEEPVKYTSSKDAKLFPYPSMPWRLEDRKENKVCWFQCYEHAVKYIQRYKLQPIKQYKLQQHV